MGSNVGGFSNPRFRADGAANGGNPVRAVAMGAPHS